MGPIRFQPLTLQAWSRVTRFLAIGLLGWAGPGAAPVGAGTITVEMEFAAPVVKSCAPGSEVELLTPGCVQINAPGLPLLPARGLTVVIPAGERVVAVRAVPAAREEIPGTHHVRPAPSPQPTSGQNLIPPAEPDAQIYGSDETYPPQPATLVTVQRAWGHDLAFVRVVPVEYRPASGRLAWFGRIALEIETAPVEEDEPARYALLRRTPETLRRLRSLVANPEDLDSYETVGPPPASNGPARIDPDHYPYVIVTDEEFEAPFQEVVSFQSSRGLRARTVLMSDILATYPGDDEPEQLRNFIIDAYQNWDTEFVLLGGDISIVPYRRLYGNIQGFDGTFPGECYYEALDGNWNDDGDGLWGEWDEFDLIGELAVGRACVETPEEFDRWWHKTVSYTESPVLQEIEKGLFLGEQLDEQTWGGNYMDEVKDYAETHGYTTSGYPETYLKETLYEMDHVWDKWELIDLMNAGFPTIHHLGHSAWSIVMKLETEDLQHITNDGITHSYMINYSQGCHPNMFHYPGDDDAIAEKMVYDEHCSAAFVGNTSYGWFFPGVTSGPSQHYERQYVDACYAEDLVQIGWMNLDSKVDCIWMLTDWLLWCHYELCVTGDPALPQWRSLEGALEMLHAGTHVIGQETYEVTVLSDGAPVENAAVTLYSTDLTIWVSATTDAMGLAVLPMEVEDPLTLQAKAVKPDYLVGVDSLIVAPASGPWLRISGISLDDDAQPPSIGDGDGLADAGEWLQVLLELENIGPETAENGSVTLSCDDDRVAVIDATAGYAPIAPGGTGLNSDDLVIQVTDLAGDGDIVYLGVEMACDGRPTWTGTVGLELHAPVLSLVSWEIDDTAYGDGEFDLDPGETIAIQVILTNAGSDEGRDLVALLSCGNGHVDVIGSESGCPLITLGGSEPLSPDFEVATTVVIPTDLEIDFDLAVTTWAGQTTGLQFTIPVASFWEEDLEADSGWIVGAPGDDATDGIWVWADPLGTWGSGINIEPEDDHSPLGTHCFVTGQGEPGGAAMFSDVDGGRTTLLSPVLDLTPTREPRLIYWRWWTNNYGPFSGEDVWQVSVSDDAGQSWIDLENTLDGINAWVEQEFFLEDYIDLTDQVQVRFVASDYGMDSLIEAAIDDITIESLPSAAAAEDPTAQTQPLRFGPPTVSPNPWRPGTSPSNAAAVIRYAVPTEGEVQIQVFDSGGTWVATLAEGRQAAGVHLATWDGAGPGGVLQPTGVYFCRVAFARRTAVGKLLLVR